LHYVVQFAKQNKYVQIKSMKKNYLFYLALLAPLVCSAEVMDKEFSFLEVLVFTVAGCIVSYGVARYKPWCLVVVLPILEVFMFTQLSEVNDPFVGPAMAIEAGSAYIYISWFSPLLILGFTFYGLFSKTRD
jgi:hypothetical protein